MNQHRFANALFHVNSPTEISVPAFREAMRTYTFAGFRGIVSPEETEAGLQAIAQKFSKHHDHATTGHSAAAVRQNFQKLVVGGESRSRSNSDARLFRAIYNPLWEEDIFGMRNIFQRLAQVRNVIAGLPLGFATEQIEANGLWTASRVHQYPRGGGFFRGHTDYVVKDVADKADTDFYQLLLLMTRKGQHFETGGGFVDKDDERICLEDYFEPGDILVYDGRTNHGVEDIDPHVPLDMDTFNGRITAFVTLYKAM